jgi:hypothetical protein
LNGCCDEWRMGVVWLDGREMVAVRTPAMNAAAAATAGYPHTTLHYTADHSPQPNLAPPYLTNISDT